MLGSLISRGLMIIFAAVVLGLSVHLAKGQVVGSVPATTGYGSFAGGFGVLAALVGFAAVFITPLQGMIMVGIDALASIILLAAGLAFAIGMRGVSCNNAYETYNNGLINGGCINYKGELDCAYGGTPIIVSRCKQVEADAAFAFLGFLAAIAAAVFAFTSGRKGGRNSMV